VAQAVGGVYGSEAASSERVRQTVRMMLQCSVQAAIEVNVAPVRNRFHQRAKQHRHADPGAAR